MKSISFRLPEFLYYGVRNLGESKGMGLSDSLRFIIGEYLKSINDSDNILKKLKDIEEKIGSLPPGVASDSTEESKSDEIMFDLDKIKKALVILGSESSRTKAPLINLFPECSND